MGTTQWLLSQHVWMLQGCKSETPLGKDIRWHDGLLLCFYANKYFLKPYEKHRASTLSECEQWLPAFCPRIPLFPFLLKHQPASEASQRTNWKWRQDGMGLGPHAFFHQVYKSDLLLASDIFNGLPLQASDKCLLALNGECGRVWDWHFVWMDREEGGVCVCLSDELTSSVQWS